MLAYTLSLLLAAAPALARAQEAVTVRHGDRTQNRIAITMDDCYDIRHIAEAVALCKQYDIAITFFPIGKALKFADSEVWQQALDAGCEIGNHSWGHTDLTRLNNHQLRFQMLRTQQKIDEMLGYHYPMQVMRPPQGKTNQKVENAVAAVGYLCVARWDVSQTDAKKAIRNVQNGSILLYHGRAKDIECLETLVPMLLDAGYECVTVSELMGLPPVATSTDIYQYNE